MRGNGGEAISLQRPRPPSSGHRRKRSRRRASRRRRGLPGRWSSSPATAMPWWKSGGGGGHSKIAQTLSPESSSSSSSSTTTTTHRCSVSSSSPPQGRGQWRDFGVSWSRREMLRRPQLTRQRKLRHLTALDVEGLRLDDGAAPTTVTRSASGRSACSSSSSSSVMMPQPLPLPEESAPAGASCAACRCCQLHSPRAGLRRGEGKEARTMFEPSYSPVESIGERFSAATHVGSKPTYRDIRRDPDQVDAGWPNVGGSGYPRNALQDHCAAENANFRLNVPPRSAPSSGFSSPLLSPRRVSAGDFFSSPFVAPYSPAVWSAPEFPSKDMPGHSAQAPSELVFSAPDRSLLHSPNLKNPGSKSKNPSGPPSPLHSQYGETATAWRDSSAGVTVHPLPLPPGVVMPMQPPSSHQNGLKNEAAPMTNHWQKGKLIGSGTFGNVYVATNRRTGALCAMKEVNLIPDDSKSAECIKQMEQEILVLSQLKHPNIVQYYGSEMVDDRFYIYLEYVYPGSINKYVQEHCGAITESVVRNFTRHILQGLAYLHSKRTMHRDVKGANLLVDASGVVKLADFGMAKHLSGASAVLSLKGTPYWMAPEVIQAMMNQDVGYDLAVDIWSLGCTIIEIFTGKHPWQGYEGAAAMFKVLHSSPCVPETLSAEGKDFLQLCFRRNPADRPTASQLLEHPFIRNAHHHDLHGAVRSFVGLSFAEAPHSSRERAESRLDQPAKGKPLSGDSGPRSDTPESRAPHLSPHSTPERAPAASPLHRNHAAQSHPPGAPSVLRGAARSTVK